MMKKSLALLLAMVMLIGLAACGGSPAETEAPSTASDVTPEALEEALAADEAEAEAEAEAEEATEETTGEFTTVEEGKLIMATNAQFPPYEFYDETGENIIGIDAEIAAAIAEKLGLELVIDDMEFGSLTTTVASGKADLVLAGMTVTEERMLQVDFTESYAQGVQVVIVAEDSAITSVDDLFADGANHVVGVQMSTTGDIYTTGDIEDAGLGTIDRYTKGADAVMALTTGKVDCVVIDSEPAKAFVEANEGLKILETEYIIEDYAAAMSKDNTALYEAVNGAISELIEDGTVQAILDTYITAE